MIFSQQLHLRNNNFQVVFFLHKSQEKIVVHIVYLLEYKTIWTEIQIFIFVSQILVVAQLNTIPQSPWN